ncbi:AB-hydrolase YheT [Marasmius fiardii PR-910]|nr:AB-hydrolase YheT [Marasmius fiardii PR-910]
MGLFCCFRRQSGDKTVVHFSSNSIELHDKNNRGSLTTLQKLVENRCPSLFTRFETTWWLDNGHVQTFYSLNSGLSTVDMLWYRRQHILTTEGGTLGLDFAPIDEGESLISDETPIIVVFPGLTGGSYEPYIKAILARVIAPVSRGGLGYRAVVVNHRGCGGVPITSPTFYTAGETEDIRQALMYLSHKFPRAQLHGIGFSVGANHVTRYVAEEGKNSRLWSACALANPWDFRANSDALEATWIGHNIYNRALGTNLQNILIRHQTALAVDLPDRPLSMTKAVDGALKLKYPTLKVFDSSFNSLVGGRPGGHNGTGPYFPFSNVDEYYDYVSSHMLVNDIKVPYLGVNSADDPIVQRVPTFTNGNDQGQNPYVVMALTAGGGHLGWFTDASGARWTTRPVLEWLQMLVQDIDWEPDVQRGATIFVDNEGWIKDPTVSHLGCKEVAGGGLIDGNRGESGVVQGL